MKYEWGVLHPHDMDDVYQGEQDRFRGVKGRREEDWGWDFWGDGGTSFQGHPRPKPRWTYWWEDPTTILSWSRKGHLDRLLDPDAIAHRLRRMAKEYRK